MSSTNQVIKLSPPEVPHPSTPSGWVDLKERAYIPLSGLAGGVRLVGGSGSGKTVLASLLAYQLWRQGRPQILVDPYGSLRNGVLGNCHHWIVQPGRSQVEKDALWSKVVLYEFSGKLGRIPQCSLLHRYKGESLAAVADRLIAAIDRWDPALASAPLMGRNAIVKCLTPCAMVLCAAGKDYQITLIPKLLRCVKPNGGIKDEWQVVFNLALENDPTVAPAVDWFTQEYAHWKAQTRERSTDALETKLLPFLLNPQMRACFGAKELDLDLDYHITQGHTVILDMSGLHHSHKQFGLNWILWSVIVEYFRHRGSGYEHPQVGLFLEEISAYQASESAAAIQLFANDINELINILRRQFRLILCVIHQENYQFDELIRKNLQSLGTQIVGVSADYDSVLALAREFLSPVDLVPKVKAYDPVFMTNKKGEAEVIDYKPTYYSLDEMHHMLANVIMRLKLFNFLVRIAEAEGGARGRLRQINISKLVPPFVEADVISQLQQQLVQGVPFDVPQYQPPVQEDTVFDTVQDTHEPNPQTLIF